MVAPPPKTSCSYLASTAPLARSPSVATLSPLAQSCSVSSSSSPSSPLGHHLVSLPRGYTVCVTVSTRVTVLVACFAMVNSVITRVGHTVVVALTRLEITRNGAVSIAVTVVVSYTRAFSVIIVVVDVKRTVSKVVIMTAPQFGGAYPIADDAAPRLGVGISIEEEFEISRRFECSLMTARCSAAFPGRWRLKLFGPRHVTLLVDVVMLRRVRILGGGVMAMVFVTVVRAASIVLVATVIATV
jgi:hypothetical protein